MRHVLVPLALFALILVPGAGQAQNQARLAELAHASLFGQGPERTDALRALAERGDPDMAATLILSIRFRNDNEETVLEVFRSITGSTADNWFDAMLWQEAHPEVVPHPSYRDVKLALFSRIDPAFLRFLGEDRGRRENLKIRLEEITWGGVRVDGIPSLDHPDHVKAEDARYLEPDDLVFGVAINGDVRAYPLRIMGWHEMFNEVIGGVPVALAYCTLCGSGILFETLVPPRVKPLVFGSSGFLYRSNKLMFDRETDSLWNQFTGQPVSGPLKDSGIALKIRPVTITTWQAWRERHPDTKVLSLETGYRRDYGSGVVYAHYFNSPDLMFPVIVANEDQVKRKGYVFGIRTTAAARAWPVGAFAGGKVINDAVGARSIVLIGDAASRTVRAYDRGERVFQPAPSPDQLVLDGETWWVTEDHLIGPDGTRLARVAGHVAYWFAWDGYLGNRSTLYPARN